MVGSKKASGNLGQAGYRPKVPKIGRTANSVPFCILSPGRITMKSANEAFKENLNHGWLFWSFGHRRVPSKTRDLQPRCLRFVEI